MSEKKGSVFGLKNRLLFGKNTLLLCQKRAVALAALFQTLHVVASIVIDDVRYDNNNNNNNNKAKRMMLPQRYHNATWTEKVYGVSSSCKRYQSYQRYQKSSFCQTKIDHFADVGCCLKCDEKFHHPFSSVVTGEVENRGFCLCFECQCTNCFWYEKYEWCDEGHCTKRKYYRLGVEGVCEMECKSFKEGKLVTTENSGKEVIVTLDNGKQITATYRGYSNDGFGDVMIVSNEKLGEFDISLNMIKVTHLKNVTAGL